MDAVRNFNVAMATVVHLMAGFAFGAVVAGNTISGSVSILVVLTAGSLILFFDSLAKRVPNLENHLKGAALILGGIYTGFLQ